MGYQEFGLIVPRHPANPREVAGLAVGLHSESPGIGAEPVSGPGSVVSCQLSVVGCRVSGVGCRVSGLICQPGANESSRPTCTSATGPAGGHDMAAAGHNFTADSATIRSVARAYDGLAAHLPRRQRPQRGNPAPPDPRHPPLGHSVDPPADRLPDPPATAALAHPRASCEPGFELWFKPWLWPQHQPSPCRFAAISVRRPPSRSIDVSHAVKSSLNPACVLNVGPQRSRRYLSHSDK